MSIAWKLGGPANVTLGTTAQVLNSLISPVGIVRSFTVLADDGNTGSVYLGDADVVSGGGEGIELTAGLSYTSPATENGLDISTVFLVGSAAGQIVRVMFWQGAPYA